MLFLRQPLPHLPTPPLPADDAASASQTSLFLHISDVVVVASSQLLLQRTSQLPSSSRFRSQQPAPPPTMPAAEQPAPPTHDASSQLRRRTTLAASFFLDADIRLARRITRDTIERGRDLNSVLEQYAKFVKPAFDDFVLPSKKYADVIIPRGGGNHVAIDLIVQHIRTKLGQHDLCKIYPNVYIINSTFQIRGMHTLIRDKEIATPDFVFYSDRLIRLVVEHGLGYLPFTEKQVVTPTGSVYTGVDFCKKLCGVSIIRSGESMENALRACCKGIKIGKILIHRVGDNGKNLIYEKLPMDISERHVLLLDPVLGTGNSANQAIELLISKGVPENHIIFLNLISAPEGIHCVCKRFPSVKIVTSEIDATLNEDFRVIPGLGEFGDRYFGTE